MLWYAVVPAVIGLFLLVFTVKNLGAAGPVLYQLLMAGAVTTAILAPAVGEGLVPGNLHRYAFIWLGIVPSIAQMALTAHKPDIFWVNFVAYAVLAAYYLDMKKRESRLLTEKRPKFEPSFQLSNKLYVLVFCLALPLGMADYRYFLPIASAWTFALWCFKNI